MHKNLYVKVQVEYLPKSV